jgi:hypothetical protein
MTSIFDRYYVANDKGFISILSSAGDTVSLKWIDGASKDVNLSAPQGNGFGRAIPLRRRPHDHPPVRPPERRSTGRNPDSGAVALDGMDAAADGTLYFTDSGDSTRAGAIYRLAMDGNLDTLARWPRARPSDRHCRDRRQRSGR